MQRHPRRWEIWTALALAGLSVACGSPTEPEPPPPPPGPTIIGLEVSGPRTVPPDGSAQFTAVVRQSDGASRDVTGETSWASTNRSVLAIAPSGMATAGERGETKIMARIQGLSSSRDVMVIPDGMYRLSGAVREGGIEITAARVEVTTGPSAGLSTLTSGSGRYALYGVAGEAEIRVTKDGYREHVQRIVVADHQTLDVALAPSQPRRDLTGTYTLTVTADDSCRDALPSELRVRSYTAVVTQNGPQLRAKLSGADFVVRNGRGDGFAGGLDASSAHATFTMQLTDDYYYSNLLAADVIERVASPQYFVIYGSVSASASDDRISGLLNGSMEVIASTHLSSYTTVATCRSGGHTFVLTR